MREDEQVVPATGERFDDWLQRFVECEARQVFAERAAAAHAVRVKAQQVRKSSALAAFDSYRTRVAAAAERQKTL